MRRYTKKFTFLLTFAVISLPMLATATTYTVSKGMSIQKTIDKAEPGDLIQVLPGEYSEAIKITTPDLRVIGMEFEGAHARLNGFDKTLVQQLEDPITIDADNVTVEGFHVRRFHGKGIIVDGRSGITLRNIDITMPASDAIRFENSTDLNIVGCVVRSPGYIGISLRKCQGVVVSRCEAYNSALGVEVRDGIKIALDALSVHDNGMGILLVNTKNEEGYAEHTTISSSRVLDSGTTEVENALTESPLFLAGVGIRIVGAIHTDVSRCHVAGNTTYGIMTEQYTVNENAKPHPAEHTYVHHNEYANNGNDPSDAYKKSYSEVPSGDLYWDKMGRRNQFQESGKPRTYPEKLLTEFGGVHTGGMHFL
ncbi:MAG TPA: hypothetical protein EYN96_05685 [Candidatus Hydrogenedentes bacterium]|nr:hypothetical protein [Candidatus Hydrogenedentota bacterium]